MRITSATLMTARTFTLAFVLLPFSPAVSFAQTAPELSIAFAGDAPNPKIRTGYHTAFGRFTSASVAGRPSPALWESGNPPRRRSQIS